MAETKVMTVEVVYLTKYGFKDGTGAYVGWSKNLSDKDKTPVVPGRSFEMEMYTADSGKQYVNKVLKQLESKIVKPVTAAHVVDISKVTPTEVVRDPVASLRNSTSMSKADWETKDRSQLIGGLSHDSATIVAAMLSMRPESDTESIVLLFSEVLNGLLKVRDSLK